MAITVAVGNDSWELGSARCMSNLLNWVAARPGARDEAFGAVLSVVPDEDTFGPGEGPKGCAQVLREIDALMALRPRATDRYLLEQWRKGAQASVDRNEDLLFL